MSWLNKVGLTYGDKALIMIIILTASIGLWCSFRSPGGAVIEIQSQGHMKRAFLDQNQTIFIQGPLGTTTVVVKDKRVKITDSPCQQKVCVKMGWKYKRGEMIACLPNEVIIRIPGKDKMVEAITE